MRSASMFIGTQMSYIYLIKLQLFTIYPSARGLVNPSRGTIDFKGYRSLQPLFDAAKDVGLWLILRPGAGLTYSLPIVALI